ncbi:MAG: DMT family transporter [Sphingomonadales bacterium]|nr:DMT family transporter [Sphingomonadales bacterium]
MNMFLYIITVLIWGSTWYAITFQFGVVPGEWSIMYRFLLSAVLLFAFCFATKRDLRFGLQQHMIFFGLGFFLFSSNYYLTYMSTELIPSGLVAIIFSLLTIMNIFNSAVFLKRKINRDVVIGAVIGVIGIGMVFMPEVETMHFGDASFMGLGLALGAAYLASLGNTVAGMERVKDLRIIPMNAWGMLYGTIILTLFAISTGKPMVYDMRPEFTWSLLYLSILGSVVAFTAYLTLVKRIGSDRAGYSAVMFPIVALAISTVFEGYEWSTSSLIGMGLVIVGNGFVLMNRTKATLVSEVEVERG